MAGLNQGSLRSFRNPTRMWVVAGPFRQRIEQPFGMFFGDII
jgi:hypothetical protein